MINSHVADIKRNDINATINLTLFCYKIPNIIKLYVDNKNRFKLS